jgi:hypothetical protein
MDLTDIPTDLSTAQVRNLLKGKPAILKPNIFNKDSQNVLRLLQTTINRIANAHKHGKGIKVVLDHAENLFKKGGKIKKIKVKNPFKGTKSFFDDVASESNKAANVIGRESKAKSKVVKRKFDERIVDSGLGDRMASELIDIATQIVLPVAGSAASMVMGDVSGVSGAMAGQMAGDQLNKYAERKGYGLFKKLHKMGAHKIGINKKNVIKRARKVGKQFIEESANIGGDAITAYTGNPLLGESFKVAAKSIANSAIDSGSGKKALQNMKGQAKHIGIELVDDYVDKNFDGLERDAIQNAMSGKYPSAKDLIYDYGNSKIEELDQNSFMTGYGVGRRSRGVAKSAHELLKGGTMCGRPYYGGAIKAPIMQSDVIQSGSSAALLNSAQMSPVFLPSPQLAAPITKKRGGSMYPAGGRHGGSMYPAG